MSTLFANTYKCFDIIKFILLLKFKWSTSSMNKSHDVLMYLLHK